MGPVNSCQEEHLYWSKHNNSVHRAEVISIFLKTSNFVTASGTYSTDEIIHGKKSQRHHGNGQQRMLSHVESFQKLLCYHSARPRTSDGMERSLKERIQEHIPKWLVDSMNQVNRSINPIEKTPTSSITVHLQSSGHRIILWTAITVITSSKKFRMLKYIEAPLNDI